MTTDRLTFDMSSRDCTMVYRLIAAWATGDDTAYAAVLTEAVGSDPTDPGPGLTGLILALTSYAVETTEAAGFDPAVLAREALLHYANEEEQ